MTKCVHKEWMVRQGSDPLPLDCVLSRRPLSTINLTSTFLPANLISFPIGPSKVFVQAMEESRRGHSYFAAEVRLKFYIHYNTFILLLTFNKVLYIMSMLIECNVYKGAAPG